MRSLSALRALSLLALCLLPACSPSCFLKPDVGFDPATVAAAPDYSDPQAWAALPRSQDHADFAPQGFKEQQAQAQADVFYIHPTAWFSRKLWNDPLNNAQSREVVDQIVLASEASAFNGCCRVFAPRYRQTSISAFYGDRQDAERSFKIAYSDVERAFDAFLNEIGQRPFILAGHSQGSMHAMRLLTKIDADAALRARLIASYIPGYAHPTSRYGDELKHILPCTSPDQLGCVASWDTYKADAKVQGAEPLLYWRGDKLVTYDNKAPRQCTNPITWREDRNRAKQDEHQGAVALINRGEPISFTGLVMSDEPLGVKITGLKAPRQKLVWAQCDAQALRVPDLDDLDYEAQETQSGNYHLLDYELFYMDVRANAILRTQAWLKANSQAEPAPTP